MVLPAGTALPPLAHAVALVAAAALVGAALARTDPPVSDATVLALAPWMAAGAATYAARQVGAVPDPLFPFAGSPTVYGTVAVCAGATLAAAVRLDLPVPRAVGAVGALAGLLPTAAAVAGAGTLAVAWPLAGLVGATVLAAAAWRLLAAARPPATAATAAPGALVVFAHALDGVSTAVGYDVLGFGERTPLSRLLIEAGAALPTEPYVGAAWLFVLVKLSLACWVVVLFADLVRDTPRRGRLLLAAVAAVGLGPGAHNLLLFTVAG